MSDECRPGGRVRVDVEGMAYGPHAIARHDGLVLFVRGAAPGERVEVEIRERRRRHAFADVVAIERRSSHRVEPVCPIVDRCGGCPWQHLDYGEQLEAKRRIVADLMRRIGGLEVEVPLPLRSPRVYGYRRRIKLRVDDRRVGFYAGGTHELVQVAHCALAESEIDQTLRAAQALAQNLKSNLRRIELVARHRSGGGVVLSGEVEGSWFPSDAEVCRRWLDDHADCAGMALRGRGWQETWGDIEFSVAPEEGLSLTIEGGGFSQVNPTANRILVDTVLETAGDVLGKAVLDAYAGAGNFSAPLARRGAVVTAIEQVDEACRSAARNSAECPAPWRVERGRVDRVLDRMARARERFDLVLLDPPRSGASESIAHLLALRPETVVYVSCDPATLARDLAKLRPTYRVEHVQPVDMFPHTYHVETVTRCRLA